MTSSSLAHQTRTADEYLNFDRAAEERHEYVDGEIVSMSGGTLAHGLIGSHVGDSLRRALGHRPCLVFTTDTRVKAGDAYFYPDVSVRCGPTVPDLRADTLHDPLLVAEVLSDSTEAYDRGRKFVGYQRIPSLAHYLLVSQREIRVEHFYKAGGASFHTEWRVEVLGPGQTLTLPTLECSVLIDEFYWDTLAAKPV